MKLKKYWKKPFIKGENKWTKLKKYDKTLFENIKHIDENGCEYWLGGELQDVLEYSKWKNFNKVIDKVKVACDLSKKEVLEHFPDVRKLSK